MRWILMLMLSGMAWVSSAQRLDRSMWMGVERNAADLSIHLGAVGSGLTTSFASALLTQDFLEREAIQVQRDKLRTINSAGFDYRADVLGVAQLKDGWAVTAGVTDVAHASTEFSDDAFRLLFEGNAAYRGLELDLSSSSFQYLRYQKFSVGLMRNNLKSSMGFRLSLINGQQWINANAERAKLSTSDWGDTLGLDLIGQWQQSGLDEGYLGAQNGAGVGLDLFLSHDWVTEEGTWRAFIDVRDLGWIQWFPGSQEYQVDTVVTFYGVEVNDFEGNAVGAGLGDSLDRAFLGWRNTGVINTWTPSWIQCSVKQERDKGFEFGLGATWRPFTVAKTYGWMLAGYQFNQKWYAGSEIGYGGFGRMQVAIEGMFHTRSVSARLRWANMEGLIFSDRLGGMMITAGIQYQFGS